MTHRSQNHAAYPCGTSVVVTVTRQSQVRTTSVNTQSNVLTLQRTGHHYKMDESTQDIFSHPLGAGLGLGSRDKLADTGVKKSIFWYNHTYPITDQ